MSLADEAMSLRKPPGTRCQVGKLLATPLRDELLEALTAVDPITAKVIPAADIETALASRIPPTYLGRQSITRHRRGECQCP